MKRELNKSKRVNWLRQYSIALFKGKRGRYTVSIVSVFVISLFVLWMISGWDIRFGEGVLYVNILEPVVTLGTFFIAAWLGARNIKEEWENQLPKKLTVHFKHKDSYVFTCHKAYLFGESDIRQMGQQIGFQMNENHSLSFYPYIKLEPTTIEKNEKEYFRHYEVTFFLSSWEKRVTKFAGTMTSIHPETGNGYLMFKTRLSVRNKLMLYMRSVKEQRKNWVNLYKTVC